MDGRAEHGWTGAKTLVALFRNLVNLFADRTYLTFRAVQSILCK